MRISRTSDGLFDQDEVAAALAPSITASSVDNVPTSTISRLRGVATPEDAERAVSLIKQLLQEEGSVTSVVDLEAARTAEIILKTRERHLAIEVEVGRLVDKAELEKLASEAARDEVNAWMNWPARVAALLASEIGGDPVVMAISLEKYVREHLAERSASGHPEGEDAAAVLEHT